MIPFLLGLFVGSFLTVFILALCVIAKESDERMEEMEEMEK